MAQRVSTAGLLAGTDDHTHGFRRIVFLLLTLVTLPTAVLLAVGILMLVFYETQLNIVFGILVVCLVICLVTGTALALFFLHREARLSRLQADFVSKVSHELRTPLTSIRLFVETLQMGKAPEEQMHHCVDALAHETTRLTERIERLLDWGRMEAGKRVYELRPDSVDEIADEALGAFGAITVGRDVHVALHLPKDLPGLMADRPAMVDALVNLLGNAYKYTGERKEIGISASADKKWVRIHVTDNGPGIPRSEHRRIFQKFYRVDDRLSAPTEGSGLGLSIVHHVARGHGGRVEVQSEPGSGSVFTVVLPRAERNSANDEST